MTSDLAGRVAIVSGVASGIGAALASELVARGVLVLGIDRDSAGLAATAARLASPTFEPLVLDLADSRAYGAAIEDHAARRGRLDLLFNNAGIVAGGELADMSEAAIEKMMRVNTLAVIHGSRAACRVMRRQRHGHVVNTASSAGLMPVPWSSVYTASKHAVVGFSLALRAEARRYGVRVSVACPGLVATGIFDAAEPIGRYDYRATVEAAPIRPITPTAAARAILRGVARNRACIVFPSGNRLLLGLRRVLPALVDHLTARQLEASAVPLEIAP
ncbi:MAG: SDR family oxidoreductase [bacterium]